MKASLLSNGSQGAKRWKHERQTTRCIARWNYQMPLQDCGWVSRGRARLASRPAAPTKYHSSACRVLPESFPAYQRHTLIVHTSCAIAPPATSGKPTTALYMMSFLRLPMKQFKSNNHQIYLLISPLVTRQIPKKYRRYLTFPTVADETVARGVSRHT